MSDLPVPHRIALEPTAQQWLFQWLRLRIGTNTWRVLFGQSLIRPTTVLAACAVIALFMFAISYGGFHFITTEGKLPIHSEIVGRLIDLLFFTLGFLLIFSTGLILFGSLFSAPEAMFLLSKPIEDDQIFSFKLQGAVAFSSWAFLLLGGPVLIAYGIVASAPWYFYLLLVVYFLGFVLMPSSFGALVMLLLVNLVPRRRMTVLILAILMVLAVIGRWIYSLVTYDWPTTPGYDTLEMLFGQIAFATSNFIPSHWVSLGLQAASRGDAVDSLYYLGLLWSNGLFLFILATWASRRLYRRGFNLLTTGGNLRKRHGGHWLDNLLAAFLFPVPARVRLLIVKDFRTFRRDPQQWGQVLIFFLLMGLYAAFLPRIAGPYMTWRYMVGVGLLNLIVVGLLISIFTSRFIYPLLSLEGRKFWVLGLMPLERSELLWGKFLFSSVGVMALSVPLILFSDLRLELPLDACLLHLISVIVLSFALSGLSVGIGAMLPNFRETDPSKIAVGFGGTVNLIAGLICLIVVITLLNGVYHLDLISAESPGAVELRHWLFIPLSILGVGTGLLTAYLPMQWGLESLRAREF